MSYLSFLHFILNPIFKKTEDIWLHLKLVPYWGSNTHSRKEKYYTSFSHPIQFFIKFTVYYRLPPLYGWNITDTA